MALIAKGNLSFKLQVGSTGPSPDPVYQLFRRSETWQGKQSDLAAFLAARPFGAVHPTWPVLKLADTSPRFLEAGMVDVSINYVGTDAASPQLTFSTDTQTQRKSIAGLKYRPVRISDGGIWTSPFYAYEVADAVREEVSYVPVVTIRYASNRRIYNAALRAAATAELATATIDDRGNYVSQVGNWRLADGQYPTWVINAWTAAVTNRQPEDVPFVFVPNQENGTSGQTPQQIIAAVQTQTRTAVIVSSGVSCNPVGISGWYETEETWEKSYPTE
jgi:hypothetical protein